MPLFITEKKTDPATTVYAYGSTDTNTYLDPPVSGTYSTYAIKYGSSTDVDITYTTNGSGKRYVVGTRPSGSGH